ncbi:nicotinate-nucleotide--dimethylbenzimidazole phosphoribosyltransferase [Ralstonia solanacearum P673]|uniref:Nicotinate-nucleotide--dimethylbenzimidazole phosphoribosyltransferase n=1 Tax=Ralstonia solanacearum (strain Po82) TaxID=1031711 RepID=F6FZ61_RALS8|nr:nicotinate-nucleotide--dimethylbenzimidazole phosphoribosyltransferase [Ralstonia solanacearum]AEG68352.1 nicotinate-nucleotide--dimethylbenzimidazole phosphoribosyltransferase [Ralstonia solanacearum Po82]AMP69631.1 nicotinate-nucleotide--dimethylbenzimidazole phosphoribosyltransferase [Ralstonia solanacearum]AMP73462.1 nicotinate-nucleotide--dimethylbenzimidazole phosphoribosyltransferase [Ralstonia solanacearum]AYB60012.1 nicotinate-nucleotide--dimethylbenzimidazole phosphoribosyltransfer
MHTDIPSFDPALAARLQAAVDSKTKPLGALGRLESLAVQIGLIQGTEAPVLARPAMVVFAADHGVAQSGVSAYPQAVTAQMVLNFIAGGAAVNVFCRQHGFALEIVNAGVATPLWSLNVSGLIDAPIGAGTRNFAHEPAMTPAQRDRAMALGAQRAAAHAELGTNVIALGEMGIGNTASAACLMARLCDLPVAQCVGRGTGLDDAGLAHKRTVLENALATHRDIRAPLDVLACFGGFEIAAMAGAMLEAARRRMVILVDGFIASAAALVATRIAPEVLRFCVFAHLSDEQGHRTLLAALGAEPLLQLSMRLGEGSGAALAYPLVVSAVAFLREMATFASAGVSEQSAPPALDPAA